MVRHLVWKKERGSGDEFEIMSLEKQQQGECNGYIQYKNKNRRFNEPPIFVRVFIMALACVML